MKLTKCQERAITALTDWYYNSTDKMITLRGQAGTGKTTALETFIEQLELNDSSNDLDFIEETPKVLVTAPTHNAKNVLRDKIKIPELQARTLYSALGLKPTYKNGDLEFELENDYYPSLPPIWMIDEISMVGQRDWKHITAALDQNPQTKLVLIGDRFQIPPVNERLSPAFGDNIQQITLKQVVRQKRSPLKNFITWSREYAIKPKSKGFFKPQISHWNDTFEGSVFEGSVVAAAEGESERLAIEYALEGLLNNPDFYQIICQTNKTKERLNYEIRDEIFLRKGFKNPKDFYPEEVWRSEQIILAGRDNVLCGANASMIILEAWPTAHLNFDCYEITAKLLEEDKIISFKALASSQEKKYKRAVEKLKQKAKAAYSKRAWIHYYELKQAFGNIQPPYASNTYDCQGRTINTVAVLTNDFIKKRATDYNRHLYTAFSRAQKTALYVRS